MPQQAKTGNPSGTKNSEDSKKEDVELTFGVFFDGTNNSKANIDERKTYPELEPSFWKKHLPTFTKEGSRQKMIASNDSYWNEDTNVVRFLNIFNKEKDNFIPVYVEGIGTKPRELFKPVDKTQDLDTPNDFGLYATCSDDTMGSAFGIGLFGVKAKVERGCRVIVDAINEHCAKKRLCLKTTNLKLKFYVFGFSRGAAAARCFSSNLMEISCKTVVGATLKMKAVKAWDKKGDIFDAAVKGFVGESPSSFLISSKYPDTLYGNAFGAIEGASQELANICRKLDEELEEENEYVISLKKCLDNRLKWFDSKDQLSSIEVSFLGLYDTVSSYGINFDDDVKELSLGKSSPNKVNTVYQVCAGDEYRANFALTNTMSYGNDYIIIPGAHSDIGGGYADGMKEKKINFFHISSGHKGKELLEYEGWFNKNENERTISNLYSILSFDLMKKKLKEGSGASIIDEEGATQYGFPIPLKCMIDGIEYSHQEVGLNINNLNEFHDKIESGVYKSYYKFDNDTIKSISRTEFEFTKEINDLEKSIEIDRDTYNMSVSMYNQYKSRRWADPNIVECDKNRVEALSYNIKALEKKKSEVEKLYNAFTIEKNKKCYDEPLLRAIRHDFLHLSAKSKEITDPIVNKAEKENNRMVISDSQ